jgi:hypothetical protein
VVKDDLYYFVTWMETLKQCKQTSWRTYVCLRTFHRDWRRHFSAYWVPRYELCCCRVGAGACEEEWVAQGWICKHFYRKAMWF